MLDLQRDALLAAGVGAGHIYSDTASGSKDERPGLASCLQSLREGDTLVLWKLDRLGRNLRHLINTGSPDDLFKNVRNRVSRPPHFSGTTLRRAQEREFRQFAIRGLARRMTNRFYNSLISRRLWLSVRF